MKKNILKICRIAIILMIPFLSFSQSKNSSITNLLNAYYAVKNALVAGDAAGAGKSASDLVTSIKSINPKELSAGEQKAFSAVQEKLLADAGALAGIKDVNKQRGTFQYLSANMIQLIKASQPSSPVYVAYCPMKKASWLTSENSIKNPYYGKSMLSCGQITETIR